MAKTTLSLDYDFDFKLIAIVSPLKDYRLCWFLNKSLTINFSKAEDLSINDKKKNLLSNFSTFEYQDELNKITYRLIANKSGGNQLLKSMKQADYLLMLDGSYGDLNLSSIKEQLSEIQDVQTVFEIDPNNLKEKDYFIF